MTTHLLCFVALLAQSPEAAGARTNSRASKIFHVAGYVPDYRLAAPDRISTLGLTELIFFSLGVGPSGDLQTERLTARRLTMLQEMKSKRGLALLVCVGGWERSQGFAKTAASAEGRAAFAGTLARFCRERRFDGADLDWEHPKNAVEAADYGLLLAAVKKAFVADGLQLTAAVADWQAPPAGAIQAVDRFHLMAYDARGRHSTPEFARTAVARLRDQGVPAAKICLGLPFYGRAIADGSRTSSYAEIIQKHKTAPETDEVDGVYFNGPKTIGAKTHFAREAGLGGVMVWELGQDTVGEDSLLRAVQRAVE